MVEESFTLSEETNDLFFKNLQKSVKKPRIRQHTNWARAYKCILFITKTKIVSLVKNIKNWYPQT